MKKIRAIFDFEVPDDTKDVYVYCEAKRRFKENIPGRKIKIIRTENVKGIIPQLIYAK